MALPAALNDLIAALPSATVVVDRGDRIAALNAPAEALLGKGLLGRHFITGLRQPALVDGVEQTLRDGLRRQCAFVARQRGADVSFDVTLAAFGPDGQVLVSFADVTRMAQADRMRRDFVANVSHELRTPLTSMIGFIETLQGPARDDPAAQARFLGIMSEEAQRMNRLVDDLLSLSKVEQAEGQTPTQRIDLCQIVATAVRNLTPRAAERGSTGAGVHEPDRERRQIWPRGRAGRGVGPNLTEPSGGARSCGQRGGARFRAGHLAAAPAASDRTVLPRRQPPQPRSGRHGAGSGDCETYPQPTWRAAQDHV